MLDAMAITSISTEDYLNKTFEKPVYCSIDVLDYNKRKDGLVINNVDFYNHPENYESDFMRFAKVTDYFIAGHFFGDGSPYLFTREDTTSEDFNIQVVADVSCDIDGPVASTIRPSTIADPIYGYDPKTGLETHYKLDGVITVMAVDNLPCELPKMQVRVFGDLFLEHVIPAFLQ